MPFDIALPQDVQNLLTLADALEREHAGFAWDFERIARRTACGTTGCAIGLAIHIGMLSENTGVDTEEMQTVFGLTYEKADTIFVGPEHYGVADTSKVTPSMVAAELRRIAAEKMGA